MFSAFASDTDSVSDPIVVRCPECGSEVSLPGDAVSDRAGSTPDDLDRLAHALCGCYVFSMSSGSIARLLAALLAVRDGDLDDN